MKNILNSCSQEGQSCYEWKHLAFENGSILCHFASINLRDKLFLKKLFVSEICTLISSRSILSLTSFNFFHPAIWRCFWEVHIYFSTHLLSVKENIWALYWLTINIICWLLSHPLRNFSPTNIKATFAEEAIFKRAWNYWQDNKYALESQLIWEFSKFKSRFVLLFSPKEFKEKLEPKTCWIFT